MLAGPFIISALRPLKTDLAIEGADSVVSWEQIDSRSGSKKPDSRSPRIAVGDNRTKHVRVGNIPNHTDLIVMDGAEGALIQAGTGARVVGKGEDAHLEFKRFKASYKVVGEKDFELPHGVTVHAKHYPHKASE